MQAAGLEGCLSETGSESCMDGVGLDGANAVAVSPDGKHVYVASGNSDAVAVLARDKTTGTLTQLAGLDGCVSETGAGPCTSGNGLDGANAVAVSPDGKHVYVASGNSDAVAVLARDKTTGALSQDLGLNGCVRDNGGLGDCADGKALDVPSDVAVSPDGKHVYVASVLSDAVAVFTRNKTTGVLTQLAGLDGCISDDGSGGTCANGKALFNARRVAVSSDGKHVYVAALNGGVAVFARNKTSGKLTQLAGLNGCVSDTGSGGECADGKELLGPFDIALSRDGKHVYVASLSNAVAVFARDKTTGTLAQLSGSDGCISETGSGGECVDGKILSGATLALSKDGKHVYVASGPSDAMAVLKRQK